MKTLTIDQYVKNLNTYNKKGLMFAQKNSLDTCAEITKVQARKDLASQFTLRNKYSQNSINYKKSRFSGGKMIREATVGSYLGYMKDQELGYTLNAESGKELIPTPEARTGRNKKKPVARRYSKPKARRAPTIKRPPNGNALGVAKRTMNKKEMFHLDKKGSKKEGVYIFNNRGKLKMVYNMTKSSMKVNKKPWLIPAVNKLDQEKIMFNSIKNEWEGFMRRLG